ncbi:MAG: TetR family transcriptional regulator C-terminal domain-containing protein [Candidatus Nanopelagicales bacterium]
MTRPTERLSADDRRALILDATIEQIIERGLASVRVEDVAAASGVSRPLVFYHFESKERLVAEAFERAAQRDLDDLDEVLESDGDVTARLAQVVRLYGPTGDAAGWRLWVDAWAASMHEPQIRAVYKRVDQQWKQAIAGLLREGTATGDFDCPDPKAAAARVTALIDGLAAQLVAVGQQPRGGALTRWVQEAAAREAGIDPAALR